MGNQRIGTFYGWRVVQAGFVLALFGWGLGFYGPPVFLSLIRDSHGWSVFLIALSQGGYAIAPAFFGLIRELMSPASLESGEAPAVFAAAALVQCLAIAALLIGRRR